MRRTMTGVAAILVAMPLLSCSMNLNWDSDKSDLGVSTYFELKYIYKAPNPH